MLIGSTAAAGMRVVEGGVASFRIGGGSTYAIVGKITQIQATHAGISGGAGRCRCGMVQRQDIMIVVIFEKIGVVVVVIVEIVQKVVVVCGNCRQLT